MLMNPLGLIVAGVAGAAYLLWQGHRYQQEMLLANKRNDKVMMDQGSVLRQIILNRLSAAARSSDVKDMKKVEQDLPGVYSRFFKTIIDPVTRLQMEKDWQENNKDIFVTPAQSALLNVAFKDIRDITEKDHQTQAAILEELQTLRAVSEKALQQQSRQTQQEVDAANNAVIQQAKDRAAAFGSLTETVIKARY